MSCPDCFKGSVHAHAQQKGADVQLHGKNCYVASPPSDSTSSSVIIYLTDSFGLNLINAKLLADRFAAETGCKVLIPDVIPGGGAPVKLMTYSETMGAPVAWTDIRGQLRRIGAALAVVWYSVPLYIRVLTYAAPHRAYPKTILPFARAVRAELPPGAKLGVVGFCWGGYGSVNLCTEPALKGGSEGLIDVQFCGHPYELTVPRMIVDAVSKRKVPFSMAIGDRDRFLGREKVEATEAALRQAVESGEGADAFRYEIRVYPGCTHGFVVRANPNNGVESAAAEQARQQAVAWLRSYL
jgi:dienelactone hydrolase